MRQQTTDNGLETPGHQSLDPGQRAVVGSQWSQIRKDAIRFALCSLLSSICGNRRKSAVRFFGIGVLAQYK